MRDALVAGAFLLGAEGEEDRAGRVAEGTVEAGEQISSRRVVRDRRPPGSDRPRQGPQQAPW